VLLKNAGGLLPLPSTDGVAVIGEFARTPRYQGAGSSQVNPTRLDSPLDALQAAGPLAFAPGFTIAGGPSGDDASLLAEAVEVARSAQTVVAFLGLPGPDESEGYDRPRLGLPDNQVALLRAVADVNPRVVVVLANGSAVTVTAWRDLAPAILETWLGGQAGGSAVADLLLGLRTPSGKLTETIPHRIEDTPAFGNFPGEAGVVRYGEGVLVGYRWYDTRAADVAYPFGHGLSYTTFAYDGITATADGTDVTVTATITNTGSVAGAEVVQVYVRDPEASVLRPTRELKAFAKVSLEPGESQEVAFELVARDLSYWHPGLHRWVVEGGEFVVEVGASSRDLRGSVSLTVEGEPLWGELTPMSTIEEWFAHPVGGPLLQTALVPPADMAPLDDTMQAMILQMPAKVIADFGLSGFDREVLDALVAQVAAS
jgi:beta-glucosidase